MKELSLDALLVTALPDIRYLTGFTGSHALAVVTMRRADFLTDSRYKLQSAREVRRFRRHVTSRALIDEILHAGILRHCSAAGLEPDHVTYAQFRHLRRIFPRLALRPVREVVENLAQVKDKGELALMTRAGKIADRVFRDLIGKILPGMTELDLASEISWLIRRHGGEREAFEAIVASGPRGALPHARPSARKLRAGEFVTIDFGVTVKGYSSDMTRTVALGRAPAKLRRAYQAVEEAHGAALRAAHAGMRASDLDAVARRRIDAYGFGRYFVHSLGHGLGLRVHERPRVSSLSKEILRDRSVITIEPGVYIPAVGGVRIEDAVILGKYSAQLLTHSPRALLTVPA
jgi:Xaa-Pro aminopeptidase